MKKLFRKLLESNMGSINIDALIELIEASENPGIVIKYLLGLYEIPEIPEVPNKDFNFYTKNKKFVSFDIISQKVNYSYNSIETLYCNPNNSSIKKRYSSLNEEEKETFVKTEVISDNICYATVSLKSWMNI